MHEIRRAKNSDIGTLKEIWKLCFGDSDAYIDLYYSHRYKEEETVVLEYKGKVVAMVTMIPVKTVATDNHSFDSVMFYAFATHPQYQHRGFATHIMDFCNQYLQDNHIAFSVLVPEGEGLFDFYRQQGYQDSFAILEVALTQQEIKRFITDESATCRIRSADPKEYNHRREEWLHTSFHIGYTHQDIAYQKKLSQASGADIYVIDIGDVQGCAVIERASSDVLLIKEILIAEKLIPLCMKEITRLLAANKYIFRIPPYQRKHWGGTVRPFGMIKEHTLVNVKNIPEECGYMGLAFD